MSIIQMQQSSIRESEKLLRIIQKYGVKCSLEFKVEEQADPILGITDAAVTVDYFEGADDEKILLVALNDADFSFSEKSSTFHKHISSSQISICISSDRFAAWFNSNPLPIRALFETKEAHQ